MFTVLDLTPLDDNTKPSIIILHPLLAPYDVDDFSLPLNFPVNAQPLLHTLDNHPVIYCHRSSCDVRLNGVPATKTPRRIHTGDELKICSADASKPLSALYAVQVAYLSFSFDLREEVSVDTARTASGAKLAFQCDTTPQFPLMLPLDGKLPVAAPIGTNWAGVKTLVKALRIRSAEESVLHREQKEHQDRQRSSTAPSNPAFASYSPPPASRTYAQIVGRTLHSQLPAPTVASSSDDLSVQPPSTSVLTSVLSAPAPSPSTFPSPTSTSTSTSVLAPRLTPSQELVPSATAIPPSLSTASHVGSAASTSAVSPGDSFIDHARLTSSRESFIRFDGLALALDRFRQGWITARRILLATGRASASPSYPPAVTPTMLIRSRIALIEHVQAQLLAIRSDIQASIPSQNAFPPVHGRARTPAFSHPLPPSSAPLRQSSSAWTKACTLPDPHLDVLPFSDPEMLLVPKRSFPTHSTVPASFLAASPSMGDGSLSSSYHIRPDWWTSSSSALITTGVQHLLSNAMTLCSRLHHATISSTHHRQPVSTDFNFIR
ncbi:hypothetical protein A4X13_0g8792 [Tilletia indica]|uniref:Uncharacterized protein n=1 Tax=Tilletia indica TaxID=43049 RepID=A0A177T3E4_9BASI|nr:hypothetical protein A4X13_0g8792 [Tilletia indica]